MGWLSKLFGPSDKSPPREVQQVFEKMRRLLDDDAAQIAMVGEPIAKAPVSKKITSVVFDRNAFKYTGPIKLVADAAREAGLKF